MESATSFSGISYRIANPSRYPEIQTLLYDNFHPDEPMSRALKIYDGTNRKPILDRFAADGMDENMSIVAIDDVTDKPLAVSINQTVKPSQASLKESLKEYDDPKFRHILSILHHVNANAGDLFKKLDTNIIFDIKIVTTDKNNRRGGLAEDLLYRSIELARVLGFKAIKTEATGECNINAQDYFTRIVYNRVACT